MGTIILTSKASRGFLLAAILLCLCGLLSPAAVAKTIHVAPDGRVSNDGTLARPVATPQQALDMAAAGDTIFLRAGRYQLTHFLWLDKPKLTFASYPQERATLVSGSDDIPTNAQSIIIAVADSISLVNLDIDGGVYYGVKIDIDKAASSRNITVRGCHIRNSGRDGIKTFNADNLLIEDCEIGPTGVRDASNAEGIDSIGSVRVTIRNCYVHDAATTGIYLKGAARDGIVENNRVERCGGAGILLGQDTDLEFMRDGAKFEAINCVARNNIIADIQYAGIGSYSGNTIRFENNTVTDVAKKGQAGFYVVTNGRDIAAQKVVCKNNIVVVNSDRPAVFLKDMADAPICDSNIYFAAKSKAAFRREAKSDYNEWEFIGWRNSMKTDARSLFTDPLLDATTLFKPRPNSPAFDRGETLPEVKTDFSGTLRPQGKAYDIGAWEGKSDGTIAPVNDNETAATKQTASDAAPSGWLTMALLGLGGGLLLTAFFLIRSKFFPASRQKLKAKFPEGV